MKKAKTTSTHQLISERCVCVCTVYEELEIAVAVKFVKDIKRLAAVKTILLIIHE